MTKEEEKLSQQAVRYVKKNKDEIIEKFAGKDFPPDKNPISVFMAGSPGAGKTEVSVRFLEILEKERNYKKVVRIDADEIREMLPGYKGDNSYIFQGATSIAVEKLLDYALDQDKNFILDGTFSNFKKVNQNVKRSLSRDRKVEILYLYQDPKLAWQLTKKREEREGRHIPKDIFIDQLFLAKRNVNKIKNKFSDRVELTLIERNYKGKDELSIDIENIDRHINFNYTKSKLKEILS